jgi:hypothetical protein
LKELQFEDYLQYDLSEEATSYDVESSAAFSGSSDSLPDDFPPALEPIDDALLQSVLTPPLQISTFLCPITQAIFRNPAVAADGHTYEFEAISKWLKARDNSPVTGQFLDSQDIRPNILIRSLLAELIAMASKKRC